MPIACQCRSRRFLKTLTDRASTISRLRLFQRWTTLLLKKYFLESRRHLLTVSLLLAPEIVSGVAEFKELLHVHLFYTCKYVEGLNKISTEEKIISVKPLSINCCTVPRGSLHTRHCSVVQGSGLGPAACVHRQRGRPATYTPRQLSSTPMIRIW